MMCPVQSITMQLLELLESDNTRALTIRYVCGLRKIFLNNLDGATQRDLEHLRALGEIYNSIGIDARKKAFEDGQYRSGKAEEPQPVEEKEDLIAERLTQSQVHAYMNVFMLQCINDDEVIFKVQTLLDYVEKKHLGGKYIWSSADVATRNGCTHWKQIVSNVLQNFKVAGKLAYSNGRREWVIL
jgi:hypothetical protein